MEEERTNQNLQQEDAFKTGNDTQQGQNQPGTYGQESQAYAQHNYRDPNSAGQDQNYAGQPNYGQQQGYHQQPNYGNQAGYNQQPNYGQQTSYYNNGGFGNQVQHGPVTDIFCYFLLAIMPLRIILGFAGFGALMEDIDYSSIQSGSYIPDIVLNGTMNIVSLFSNLLMILFIVFVILDIVKINQQKYKITGLILFAVFFNPGYYIWRAHILGRKKTIPIIYTVAFSLLLVIYCIFIFYQIYAMALGILQAMY